MPPTATPFLPLWAVDPTDLTFSQLKKEFGGGKNQKVVKVRAGGSGQPLAGKRRGLLNSAFFLKIGSSGVVKFYQYKSPTAMGLLYWYVSSYHWKCRFKGPVFAFTYTFWFNIIKRVEMETLCAYLDGYFQSCS